MTQEIARRMISDMDGPAALPRRNGEPVFQAPWESRAFAMAVSLSLQGAFEWEEFRQQLIDEIANWEKAPGPKKWSYYERWLAALEKLLDRKEILAMAEISGLSENMEGDYEHSSRDHDDYHDH